MAPSLADLRYAFFSPEAGESVSDAEYRQLQALYASGITLPGLAVGASRVRSMRNQVPADWTQWLFTADAVNAPAWTLSFEHGDIVTRVQGGTGTQSDLRLAWEPPDVIASEYSWIRSRWASPTPGNGIVQHPQFHRMQLGDDGRIRALVCWDGILGIPAVGVWESDPDGTDFIVNGFGVQDSDAVSAGSRTSNVVTLTVPAGATTRWFVGDPISVDMSDNTYDGTFIITGVTSTTITYAQTAADDASAGTGSVTLLGADRARLFSAGTDISWQKSYAFTDAARTSESVVSTGLPVGHGLKVGDHIVVDAADNTYDGLFYVTAVNTSTGQITWKQTGVANDASAGAGTVAMIYPLVVESRVIPGPAGDLVQARWWPDFGLDASAGTPGPIPLGPPPWDSAHFAQTYDVNDVTTADAPVGIGTRGVGAAHLSTAGPVRIDNFEEYPLYF